jgi:hypothetical protein
VPNLVREILDDVFVSSDATEELEHLADDVELGVVHPLRGSEKKKTGKKKEPHLEPLRVVSMLENLNQRIR